MKIYNVKQPFMSRKGQFEEGKHTLCIGIERKALKKAFKYRVFIGKNKKIGYDITYSKALDIYEQYGENALWRRNGRQVFILPIFAFDKKEL